MSAAEKLRVLDEAISREPSNADWGWDDDEIGALRRALPEIIAVVKAAEECRGVWLMKAVLADALSALDEKLGDVTP